MIEHRLKMCSSWKVIPCLLMIYFHLFCMWE